MSNKPTTSIAELLISRRYNPNHEPPEEKVIFRIEFNNIGSLGNFITITGLPKAGKSKYIAGMIAAAISRTEIFGLSLKLPEGKNRVGHFDTEQSIHDYYRMMDIIKKLSGFAQLPSTLDTFNTREDGPTENIMMIEQYLNINGDCGLLFLDGLLDLIYSFNDEVQSKELINFLKRWTKVYNILVVAILHRSKSVDKSIGHLGAAADRAAQSILIVEKNRDRNTYILKPEYLRSAEDFTPIEIYFNKGTSTWEQTEHIPEEQDARPAPPRKRKANEYDIDEHRINVIKIFNSQAVQPYKMFVQNICEVYATGQNWAKDCVNVLCTEGLVYRTNEGYTNIKQGKLFVAQ